MLHILVGEDSFSLHQRLEEIKGGLGDPTLLVANTITLEGQQVTVNQLKAACETVPFLAEKRLVIIHGLLERFEPPSKSARAKPAGHQAGEYEPFAICLGALPASTELVLIDSEVKSSNPLFHGLSPKAKVSYFPLLKGDKLSKWVQRRVAEVGGRISPEAVDLLVSLVGGDLWTMANEINKLVSYTSGRSIEEDDVKAIVSSAQEVSVFVMVDAVLEAKVSTAQQSLQQLLQRGATLPYLLVMLSRQVRLIIRAKTLTDEGKHDSEIQKRLGLVSDFALRKTLEQASRYSWERIIAVHRKLLETDLAIKTGKYEDDLAFNILIAELCQAGSLRRGTG